MASLTIDGKRRRGAGAEVNIIEPLARRTWICRSLQGRLCRLRAKLFEGEAEMDVNYSLSVGTEGGFIWDRQAPPKPVSRKDVVDTITFSRHSGAMRSIEPANLEIPGSLRPQ